MLLFYKSLKNFLIILLFSCIAFIGASQNVLDQAVDLSFQQIKLKDLISKIEKDYNLHFSYSNIFLSKKISIKYKGHLSTALDKIFLQTNLEYKLINQQIVIKRKSIGVIKGSLKGQVLNAETSVPIMNVSIVIKNREPFTGTASDLDGYFSIKNLPTKRYSLLVQALGFESIEIPNVLVSAGKELYLNIELIEKINQLNEVVVEAKINKHEAINKMALTSARAFSVEETQRYAMSISDPARMARNYAGVTNAGDDSSNDLVVRGNSPRGLLWRLEGIEIPNPNHFGKTGAKGGIISILNSSTLSNSDFYTSTFPTEFGNAISGVFDLKLKKGNQEKREHSISISLLGVEGATEGFFAKKSKVSYILKYRFSTLNLIKPLVIDLKESVLAFQDLALKVYLPTKKLGVFSVFGIAGYNTQINKAVKDTSLWETREDRTDLDDSQIIAVFGVSNKKILSPKTYLKSIIGSTIDFQKTTIDLVDTNSTLRINDTDFKNINFIASFTLNHQLNKKHFFQTGIVYELKKYEYFLNLNENNADFLFFNSNDYTHFIQSFINWKYRISNKLTLNTGFHFSFLDLNKSFSLDPRLGIKYRINNQHSLAFSAGLYSRPEHLSTYLLENTLGLSFNSNLDLKMNKSVQTVLEYNNNFAKDFNIKAEIYYQYLFDIPVSTDSASSYSTLNSENVFDIMINNTSNGGEMVSEGQGQNYGIDLTLEKYFSKGYYGMITASLFDSKFKNRQGQQFYTKFANHFLINILGGKEFVVGKNKNNFINLNGKLVFNGGRRYTPIDIEKTKEIGNVVRHEDQIYSKQFTPYYRLDLGINYKLNTKYTTHTFSFDVQNVTNNKNSYDVFYNFKEDKIETKNQLGIIPFVKYKLEFSFNKKENE